MAATRTKAPARKTAGAAHSKRTRKKESQPKEKDELKSSRAETERKEIRRRIVSLSKRAAALSSEMVDLLKSKAIDKQLVPDVELGKTWEERLKPKLREICRPIEPRDWVSQGNELRVTLARALGSKVLRQLSSSEATLEGLLSHLLPEKEKEKKQPQSRAAAGRVRRSKGKSAP